MKIAYLILKSPHELEPAELIGRFSSREDSVAILIEDGVYHAIEEEASRYLSKAAHEILVSGDDLLARGLSANDLKHGRIVDYEEIVDWIMERTERTITI
jgi:sulfur relay protein TusB/DsrH